MTPFEAIIARGLRNLRHTIKAAIKNELDELIEEKKQAIKKSQPKASSLAPTINLLQSILDNPIPIIFAEKPVRPTYEHCYIIESLDSSHLVYVYSTNENEFLGVYVHFFTSN